MCIFILTILVPLPDSFVLLFSAVTVEFPFRFIKVYLISSQTLRNVSEEKTRFFLFFSPVCDLSEPTVYTYTRSNDNREQRFGMFPIFFFLFPSATFNKPLGWTESLLCVSMQRRLILDRSADTFHPGDFVDSTGNVLNPTGRYYLHRRPRRS